MIHIFQTYHPLRHDDFPLLPTNLLVDIPSPISILETSTSVRFHHSLLMIGNIRSHHFPIRKIFTNYDDIFITGSSLRAVLLVAESITRSRLWFHCIHTVTTSTGIVSDSYNTSEATIDLSCHESACTSFS